MHYEKKSEPIEVAECDEHGQVLYSLETGECIICRSDDESSE